MTRPLKAEMDFQVSVAFTKGVVRPGLIRRVGYLDREAGHIFSAIAIFMACILIVIFYFIVVWSRVGKDPGRESATPEYEPPEEISPAMMRYIVTRGRFDEGTVAATLVKCAQCGAIRIAKEENLYRISRTGEALASCLPEEKAFLDNVFARSESMVVGVRHASKTLRSVTGSLKDMLRQEYKRFFVSSSRYLWRLLALSVAAAAGGLFFLDLPFHGRESWPLIVYSGFALILLCIMLAVYYSLLKAPTEAGSKIMGRIEGFRKFLAVNYEKARSFGERSETDAPPFLEKHLPYAIALGIDSEYVSIRAKSFDWYAGRPGGFSPYDFTSSLKWKNPGIGKQSRLIRSRCTGAGL